MVLDRRTVMKGLGVAGGLGFAGTTQAGGSGASGEGEGEGNGNGGRSRDGALERDLTVTQESGKSVHWILPGKRELETAVFGTPENPQFGQRLLEHNIAEGDNENLASLLQELPFPVAVPEEVRETEDGEFTTTSVPTPFSDKAKQVDGELDVTYMDRGGASHASNETQANDAAEIDVSFEDPAGHTYEVDLKHLETGGLIHETGGGVMSDAVIHGDTAIGMPLEPRQYVYGAFWGAGDLLIDGEVVDENREIHFMTTETVRNEDYELVFGEDLPLSEEEAFAGQSHHTHGIFPLIKATDDGPVFDPVSTSFELPNGETQPFIHVMFDEDTIVDAD